VAEDTEAAESIWCAPFGISLGCVVLNVVFAVVAMVAVLVESVSDVVLPPPAAWAVESGPGMASPSLQFAGVGGTGPRAETPLGGGRLVGGETIGSLPEDTRWTLWDRMADGGGPGGGGGKGIEGSHLTWDDERDLAEVGVDGAGVDAALRAPGGPRAEAGSGSAGRVGICNVSGRLLLALPSKLNDRDAEACSDGDVFISGDRFRPKVGKLNRLSRELPLDVGGGGKDVVTGVSGAGLCN